MGKIGCRLVSHPRHRAEDDGTLTRWLGAGPFFVHGWTAACATLARRWGERHGHGGDFVTWWKVIWALSGRTIGRLKDGTSTVHHAKNGEANGNNMEILHKPHIDGKKNSRKSPWCQEPGQSRIDMLGVLHWLNMVKWCYIIHDCRNLWMPQGRLKKHGAYEYLQQNEQFLDGLFDWYPMGFLGVSTSTI